MPSEIMTVEFTTTLHNNAVRFVIPKQVLLAFNWKNGDEVGLLIFSEDGECRFCGKHTMMSGPEIYGPDVRSCFKPGERIHVYAFRYPSDKH
jgi:hypothetical protein